MQSALADPSTFASLHGVTAVQLGLIGDLNGDTRFTNADLQKLLDTLKSGGGSIGVPEPESFILMALTGIGLLAMNRSAAAAPHRQ